MSKFSEISDLRKSGKLEEAREKAEAWIQEDLADPWAKKAVAWVYYEYLKQNTKKENSQDFLKYLTLLKKLELGDDEKMVYDQIAWQVGKILFDISHYQEVDWSQVNALFDGVKTFNFTRPLEGYSFLFKAFHKFHQNWSRYLEFVDWWGLEHFLPKDFEREELQTGEKVMALVEQAYIGYAKKILEGEHIDIFSPEKTINQEKIQSFLPKLDQIIEKHPEYQFPPYYKAKLLLELGEESDALSAFLPFARAKQNEFWVWDLVAEIFSDDREKVFSCFCKALSCPAPSEYLVKVRERFAEILIEDERFSEAKAEIDQLISDRKKRGWSISRKIQDWVHADWYAKAAGAANNKSFYQKYAPTAEALLFSDAPEQIGVVERVNRDKQTLQFIISEKLHGGLSYRKFLKKVQPGDFIKVRLEPGGRGYFFKAISLSLTDQKPGDGIFRLLEGRIEIPAGKDFGFLNDAFMPAYLLAGTGITSGDQIRGLSVRSYHEGKGWGWKVVRVEN